MSLSLIQRLNWQTESGEILDDDRRYLMMRTDVLMGGFRNLPAAAQRQAFLALQQSVRDNGGKSVHAYFDSLNHNAGRLLETMADFSAQVGWGVWSIQMQDGSLTVQVRNSPFAQGYGRSTEPVCYAIAGMLEALGEVVLRGPVHVCETQCSAQGHAHCILNATRTPDSSL
ncbi:V4R domain-containing protein [Pusillimonas sp.]|uniref:V4R domain-containing protein n=1 Tax=Pusillimonas sp. TaxID=3040095 RepID=UPI0037C61C4B